MMPKQQDKAALPKLDYTIEPSTLIVKEMPAKIRPREAVDRVGVTRVDDEALLAVLLRSGARGLNVVDLASGLLARFGTLGGIALAADEELMVFPGMGPVKIRELRVALEIGRRMTEGVTDELPRIKSPEDVVHTLRREIHALDAEVFWALLLNAKNRLVCRPVDVSRGILDASLVHPREVFKAAIRTASAAVVLAHNHPSGDPSPSAEDIRITRQLVEAGKIIDIKVMDHVVVGRTPGLSGPGFISMRESGLVDFS